MKTNRFWIIAVGIGLFFVFIVVADVNEGTIPCRAKYLVLDARVIAEIQGAELTLGRVEKDSRNPLFGEEHPWEVRFDNLYPNVIYDPE